MPEPGARVSVPRCRPGSRCSLDVSIRRTVELEHTVVHWSEFDRGGPLRRRQAPDLLVDDVREFFSKLR